MMDKVREAQKATNKTTTETVLLVVLYIMENILLICGGVRTRYQLADNMSTRLHFHSFRSSVAMSKGYTRVV